MNKQESVLTALESRGLLSAITHDNLRAQLLQSTPFYIGFDPSASSLHLGSLLPLIVCRWFQLYGHRPVIILGGATGRIGDPSGKDLERPLLDEDQIQKNVRAIRQQIETILNTTDSKVTPLVLDNFSWFDRWSVLDFLRDIGKYFRVNSMLAKESVKQRIESESGISFTEFSYSLMQAYDFLYLFEKHRVPLQIGGSDQWGNITAGIELIRRRENKEAFGLTFPLLTRSDGRKFGKSERGAIWLSEEKLSSYHFYQYFFTIPDSDIVRMLHFLTFLPLEEIAQYEADLKSDKITPNQLKTRLAEEVTQLVHGKEGVKKAQQATKALCPGAKREEALSAEDIEQRRGTIPFAKQKRSEMIDQPLSALLVKCGFFQSKGEVRRLIQNKGLYCNRKIVEESEHALSSHDCIGDRYFLIGIGKKKQMVIEVVDE